MKTVEHRAYELLIEILSLPSEQRTGQAICNAVRRGLDFGDNVDSYKARAWDRLWNADSCALRAMLTADRLDRESIR